ncbi:phosphotransferase family protein [Novosphingobium sp. Gsoil 351]|uniref:phosphotransferase family protein n=1 Tax=Novosphingobium sp. Gsoil 351 TaxID=2675225 RepID=UPI001E5E6C73|nr:ecdysteroid 22-kinase family protein [Novosphingobium sp. Gsoil 351]
MRRAGALERGAVATVDWQPIGTGQVGDSARFALTYDQPGAGPATLAGKFPAADPTSRQTAVTHGLYAKEVAFYGELVDGLRIRTPRALAAQISDDGGSFVLLFEDLGPARGGNQLAGCSLADARQAVSQLAGLHAPSWGDTGMTGRPWLAARPGSLEALSQAYPLATQVFAERYAGQLAPELMDICHGLAARIDRWFGRTIAQPCLVHGDYRLDNMLFEIKGGAEPLGVLDWQTLTVGSGLTDLAYFIGAGVGTTLAAHEDELVALYLSTMAANGVRLARDAVWDDYRRGALHGVSTAVFSAAFVERTPRGDAMFLDMARGACQLALKHDSLGAL